jgi:hypothetical protein
MERTFLLVALSGRCRAAGVARVRLVNGVQGHAAGVGGAAVRQPDNAGPVDDPERLSEAIPGFFAGRADG